MRTYAGFTLLETMVVIGIITLLSSTTAYIGIGEFTKILSYSDTNRLVTFLRDARSKSLTHSCDGEGCMIPLRHGIHIEKNILTEFSGESFEDRNSVFDITLPLEHTLSISGGNSVYSSTGTPPDTVVRTAIHTDALPVTITTYKGGGISVQKVQAHK